MSGENNLDDPNGTLNFHDFRDEEDLGD